MSAAKSHGCIMHGSAQTLKMPACVNGILAIGKVDSAGEFGGRQRKRVFIERKRRRRHDENKRY